MNAYGQKSSVAETKETIEQYLHAHDTSRVADDAIFVVMGNGQESKGRAAIGSVYGASKVGSAGFEPAITSVLFFRNPRLAC